MNKKKEVLLANKKFYDQTAEIYDLADGRRSAKLDVWLSTKLKSLAKRYGNDSFLDLGCGSGFVMKSAGKYFKNVVGVDISPKMLKKAKKHGRVVCADIAQLPFKKENFDVVVAFATLHHCYDFSSVFKQVYRVLKSGGCFYSDHDMETHFAKRFRLPLFFYRLLRNPSTRYRSLAPGLKEELYEKSEYHSQGINALKLKNQLKDSGFAKIKIDYHWFGLNPLTDKIFNKKKYRLSLAPLLSVEAVKCFSPPR